MDAWNVAILLAAGYVAVITLARLMIRRRNQMMEQFRHEVEQEKRRRDAEQSRSQPPERERAACARQFCSAACLACVALWPNACTSRPSAAR